MTEQNSAGQSPPHHSEAEQDTTPDGEEQSASSDAWFDETWTKVHPLSPLVRGWLTIVAIPAAILGTNWGMWSDLWNAYRSGELADSIDSNPTPYLLGAGGFLALAVIIFVGFTLTWWYTRYKITDEHVMVKSGIFVRQHRQARIDRVQAVDLRQPLLARITQLAELKFEVAEGDGTAATLAFLRKSEAEALRAEIMDRAAGTPPSSAESDAQGSAADGAADLDPGAPGADHAAHSSTHPSADPSVQAVSGHGAPAHDPDAPAPTAPAHTATAPAPAAPAERQLVTVPLGRLAGSIALGVGSVFLIIAALGGLGIAISLLIAQSLGGGEGWRQGFSEFNFTVMIPVVIVIFVTFYQQISSGFRFTATMTTAGLRLSYGLLETTSQTVPPGRVQAISIQQPLLWRMCGWYKMNVTVAGYGITGRNQLLPVGTLDDVRRLTAEMFPDLRVDDPERLFREGLSGTSTEQSFTHVPKRARIFDPLVWRRRGFSATESTLLIRDGWTTRVLTMVPHERIQSVALQQGPWARAKSIATVVINIPTGPFVPRVKNQDLDQVHELFAQEAEFAAVARRLADRNQWMKPEELREFERSVTQPPQAAPRQTEGASAHGSESAGAAGAV